MSNWSVEMTGSSPQGEDLSSPLTNRLVAHAVAHRRGLGAARRDLLLEEPLDVRRRLALIAFGEPRPQRAAEDVHRTHPAREADARRPALEALGDLLRHLLDRVRLGHRPAHRLAQPAE